nr:VP1 [Cat Tien Macrotermes solemo-like virus]
MTIPLPYQYLDRQAMRSLPDSWRPGGGARLEDHIYSVVDFLLYSGGRAEEIGRALLVLFGVMYAVSWLLLLTFRLRSVLVGAVKLTPTVARVLIKPFTLLWPSSVPTIRVKLVQDTPTKVSPASAGFKPEVSMPGSSYFTIAAPDGQFAFISGQKIVGHGVRMGDYLVAPSHVVSCSSLIRVDTRTGSALYDLSALTWTELSTDVSFVPMPVEISGLPSAKVGPASRAMAQCTKSEKNFGSVGQLDLLAHDLLAYFGSTCPGMSGTAYVQNNRVVGMHMGGNGAANLGVPTELIALRLRALRFGNSESSDFDILMDKLSARDRKELKYMETGDPDMFEVSVRGRYYRVDREELEELMGGDDSDELIDAFEDLGDEGSYRQKRTKSSLSSQRRFRVGGRAVQLECDPPAVQPAVDPLPEFASGNEMRPATLAGLNSKAPSRTGPAAQSTESTTSSVSPRLIKKTTSGHIPTQPPSQAPSIITKESAMQPSVESYLRQTRNALASLGSSTTDTGSHTLSLAIISQLTKAISDLSSSSRTSIAQQAPDSGSSPDIQPSAKHSAGMVSASRRRRSRRSRSSSK